MHNLERLGSFYLGRMFDLSSGKTTREPLLYDAKDLTTHAACIGMTGSGKTGLCITLLEEAAIDGIPAIAIDPKGDLGNLMLSFPNLNPDDFRPWVDAGEAARAGMNVDQFAAHSAQLWRDGLASWDQDGERIRRFREAAEVSIYTPGSTAGKPLSVLRSFQAPSRAIIEDKDALSERISAATSGLLALLGVDADPIRSREHILIANLLDRAWQAGKSLDIAGLIREIQSPPLERVGFMDLESFFPAKDRAALAMTLNNLLASPGFSTWLEGDPLDVQRLLYTAQGRPRLSIVSIAHLSESERMLMVTILLNEVLAWVRMQGGTSSLRALLYMDEVFGFFPPTANPPSKKPMLTLLKQARAYGLGIVLATQNPVDLDYKGLSNTGTWFLGRLQTERDKLRVLDGLEGATTTTGMRFDRAQMEATLSGLGQRVFLMNNVHEDQPVVFHTRWALSYLRGPLTRAQIQTLMSDQEPLPASPRPAAELSPIEAPPVANPPAPSTEKVSPLPVVPATVRQRYLACSIPQAAGMRLVYRPAVVGLARLHFVRATYKVDYWTSTGMMCAVHGEMPDDIWDAAETIDAEQLSWDTQPVATAAFSQFPAALTRATNYKSWSSALKSYLYREQQLALYRCAALKTYSDAGEAEGDFRVRLRQAAVEARDLAIEKLRAKYASKLATMKDRIRRAEEKVQREKEQSRSKFVDSAITVGSTILGAMFGRKLASRTNVSRAGTAAKSVGRAARERGDIARAEESLDELQEKLNALEKQFEQELEEIRDEFQPEQLELEELTVRPRKSDIAVEEVVLAWTPWHVDSTGIAQRAW